jgi:hypothetical protein
MRKELAGPAIYTSTFSLYIDLLRIESERDHLNMERGERRYKKLYGFMAI